MNRKQRNPRRVGHYRAIRLLLHGLDSALASIQVKIALAKKEIDLAQGRCFQSNGDSLTSVTAANAG